MSVRFHGITSILFVLAAVVIAVATLSLMAWIWGAMYLLVCVWALVIILYAYCAKCTCQAHCGHVFPGKLARALMRREPGPYTTVDMAAVGVGLLALIVPPLFWLWRYPALLAAFVVLFIIAAVQVRMIVCRACDNALCALRRTGGQTP